MLNKVPNVKLLGLVYACGHAVDIKVSRTIIPKYERELVQDAKRTLCLPCRRAAEGRAAPDKKKPSTR